MKYFQTHKDLIIEFGHLKRRLYEPLGVACRKKIVKSIRINIQIKLTNRLYANLVDQVHMNLNNSVCILKEINYNIK